MHAEKVDVLLRDEKEYIGILRSYDQFGGFPSERFSKIVTNKYSQSRPH